MLAQGKLFETIELLEQVLETQPEQADARRNLVFLLFNAEQHRRAQHHGQLLIRQRAFDKSVLFWMATYEQRDIPPAMMNGLVKLNPTDARLQIARLRVLFDNGEWDEFPKFANQILEASPEFVPAQLLQGQYLIQTGPVGCVGDVAEPSAG